MKKDATVTEVRKARAKIIRECGNDLARSSTALAKKEQGKRSTASRSPKRKPRTVAP